MSKKSMNQDRRDAMLWAEEWQIRQKRRKMLIAVLVIAVIAAVGTVIHFVSIGVSRTTFSSEAEMKEALQGRFETDYAEDIEISGDTVTLTYYNRSHYDLEYAERYGYSEYEDSVYEDNVVEWDYRSGEIKCKWMDTITVDKDGNLVYYEQTFKKTDDPKPVPIDPSELSIFKQGYDSAQDEINADSEAGSEELSGDDAGTASDDSADAYEVDPDLSEEEQDAQEAVEESRIETQAAASEAGIEALPEGTADE